MILAFIFVAVVFFVAGVCCGEALEEGLPEFDDTWRDADSIDRWHETRVAGKRCQQCVRNQRGTK